VPAQRGGQIGDDGRHQVGQWRDGAARLQHPGLDAAHVEQVLHEVGEAVRLHIDKPGQALPGLGADVEPGVGQRGRRCLDRGERRPQVVGDRGDQGLRQARHLVG
jgi:hypothetical protein